MHHFTVGDRVQVADSWFVEELRGLRGTVAFYPPEVSHRNLGAVWIEFDEVWPADSPLQRTDAAEVSVEHLTMLEQQDF